MKYILILMLLMLPFASAYVWPEYYHGVPVKYYQQVNKTDFINALDSINETYFIGLKYIHVFDGVNYCGGCLARYYYFSNGMAVCYHTDYYTSVAHELAHHKNAMDKIPFPVSASHGVIFNDALEEIKGGLREKWNIKKSF